MRHRDIEDICPNIFGKEAFPDGGFEHYRAGTDQAISQVETTQAIGIRAIVAYGGTEGLQDIPATPRPVNQFMANLPA